MHKSELQSRLIDTLAQLNAIKRTFPGESLPIVLAEDRRRAEQSVCENGAELQEQRRHSAQTCLLDMLNNMEVK